MLLVEKEKEREREGDDKVNRFTDHKRPVLCNRLAQVTGLQWYIYER